MEKKDQTVVILLSDKRSGSTLFQREICKHHKIQTVSYSPHTYEETHHWLKGAVILGMNNRLFAGNKVYSGYGSRKNARAYLIDEIIKNVPDFEIPEVDKELIFNGWEALCEKYAQPVFFEKSPQILANWASLSLMLEWIHQTSYKVKIIGLVRNPLSVQYSAFQLFHTNPQTRQYSWLEIQKNLLAFQGMLPQDMFYNIRYEDIIHHPQESFADICKFIGIETCSDIGAGAHVSSLEKWKTDPYFALILDESVKQIAYNFGYSSGDLDNANECKTNPSLKWYLKNKVLGKLKRTYARLKDRVVKPLILRFRQ